MSGVCLFFEIYFSLFRGPVVLRGGMVRLLYLSLRALFRLHPQVNSVTMRLREHVRFLFFS